MLFGVSSGQWKSVPAGSQSSHRSKHATQSLKLPNVGVDFKVLSGPNANKIGHDVTDAQGNARFTYTSGLVGTDTVQASVTNSTGATNTPGQKSNPTPNTVRGDQNGQDMAK